MRFLRPTRMGKRRDDFSLVKYQVETAPAMVTCWQAMTNWVIQKPPKMW